MAEEENSYAAGAAISNSSRSSSPSPLEMQAPHKSESRMDESTTAQGVEAPAAVQSLEDVGVGLGFPVKPHDAAAAGATETGQDMPCPSPALGMGM